MNINKKDITSVIFELDSRTFTNEDFGMRALHIYDLKEVLKPIIKKYGSETKSSGRVEGDIFDIAIDYLVKDLDWSTVSIKGQPGYFVSL